MPNPERPRVLLVDDYERLLEAWRRLLEPSCEIVGSVTSGYEALQLAQALKPDVIVVDLSMPGLNGFDVCRKIREIAPATRVVLVSADDNEALRNAAERFGAAAFVAKSEAADELEDAIQLAVQTPEGKPSERRNG
jgi:two-component system, NarL family, nitrate/nitrite response regulator NarL